MWEQQMFDLLDSLEARAELEFAAERDAEVADRVRAEYRQVTLASRLHASVGSEVVLRVDGVGPLGGTLRRVGAGWCLIQAGARSWLVFTAALMAATGLNSRSVPEAALGVVERLGPGSPLRRLAESQEPVLVHLRGGGHYRGLIGRVGADFVELNDEAGQLWLVAFEALAAVASNEM